MKEYLHAVSHVPFVLKNNALRSDNTYTQVTSGLNKDKSLKAYHPL